MEAESERIIQDLRAEVDQLRREIGRFKHELEEAQRAAARPTAPFRRPVSKKIPAELASRAP
jgi:hypothetical protein